MEQIEQSVREEIARRTLSNTCMSPTVVARYVALPREDVVQMAVEVRSRSRGTSLPRLHNF